MSKEISKETLHDEPISKQSAVDAIHRAIYDLFDDDETEKPFSEKDKLLLEVNKAVSRVVRELPSAQPEIITCERCKYSDGEKPIADGRCWCILHGSFMYYCSDAERREDGSD